MLTIYDLTEHHKSAAVTFQEQRALLNVDDDSDDSLVERDVDVFRKLFEFALIQPVDLVRANLLQHVHQHIDVVEAKQRDAMWIPQTEQLCLVRASQSIGNAIKQLDVRLLFLQ